MKTGQKLNQNAINTLKDILEKEYGDKANKNFMPTGFKEKMNALFSEVVSEYKKKLPANLKYVPTKHLNKVSTWIEIIHKPLNDTTKSDFRIHDNFLITTTDHRLRIWLSDYPEIEAKFDELIAEYNKSHLEYNKLVNRYKTIDLTDKTIKQVVEEYGHFFNNIKEIEKAGGLFAFIKALSSNRQLREPRNLLKERFGWYLNVNLDYTLKPKLPKNLNFEADLTDILDYKSDISNFLDIDILSQIQEKAIEEYNASIQYYLTNDIKPYMKIRSEIYIRTSIHSTIKLNTYVLGDGELTAPSSELCSLIIKHGDSLRLKENLESICRNITLMPNRKFNANHLFHKAPLLLDLYLLAQTYKKGDN